MAGNYRGQFMEDNYGGQFYGSLNYGGQLWQLNL